MASCGLGTTWSSRSTASSGSASRRPSSSREATSSKVFAEPGKVPRLDEVKQAIRATDNLKAVYTVHNETSTGCAIPYIQELAKAAHEKDAFMVVDGVSSIGGYSVPVDAWGVDMCVTASQKCIAAPPGIVIVSLNSKVAAFLKKTPPTVRYFDLGKHLDFLEHGYTPYTPAVSLYYALEEALAELHGGDRSRRGSPQAREVREPSSTRPLSRWASSPSPTRAAGRTPSSP